MRCAPLPFADPSVSRPEPRSIDDADAADETPGQTLVSNWLMRVGQLENLRTDVMDALRDGMAVGRSARDLDEDLMRLLCERLGRIVAES